MKQTLFSFLVIVALFTVTSCGTQKSSESEVSASDSTTHVDVAPVPSDEVLEEVADTTVVEVEAVQ